MNSRPRTYQRSFETAERDAEIARYCITHTITDAAAHFGLNKSSVSRARRRAFAAVLEPAGREAKAAELVKYDAMEAAAWTVLNAEHIYVSDGRVVRDRENDGALITDHKPVLDAINTLLRISDRRAKLLGLDAPTRKVVEVVTDDVVNAAIRELEAELATNDPAGGSADREAAAAEGVTGTR